ncbi:MAG: hypothetical protein ABSA18_02320 [Dehalococcoidia bacterium]|jgi:uncharacterized protein (DUF2267 family)
MYDSLTSAIVYPIFIVILIFALLGFLSYSVQILKLVFKPIIKSKFAFGAAFISYCRVFLILALLLDAFLIFVFVSTITSAPDKATGTLVGVITSNCTISENITFVPNYSFSKQMLAVISTAFVAALVATLISTWSSSEEKSYAELRDSIFPLINENLCQNNIQVADAIKRMGKTYNRRTEKSHIKDVLGSMKAHIN